MATDRAADRYKRFLEPLRDLVRFPALPCGIGFEPLAPNDDPSRPPPPRRTAPQAQNWNIDVAKDLEEYLQCVLPHCVFPKTRPHALTPSIPRHSPGSSRAYR
jgi:hypothetical protein